VANLCFCDGSKLLPHPTSVSVKDFGGYYNCWVHPPTSIALQSWGIFDASIRVLSMALQTTRFCLRRLYLGSLQQSYDGSINSPLVGSGQGNSAPPPSFATLSTLVVNTYWWMGHGANLVPSCMSRKFLIAAVIYVDDTDLLQ